jgi:hypothetical protein
VRLRASIGFLIYAIYDDFAGHFRGFRGHVDCAADARHAAAQHAILSVAL